MYNERYHFRQQGASEQDSSWLNGNFDFIAKIMGFSFFASLFGGLGGIPGGGDRGGGATGSVDGGQASYVWNTIRLVFLGLLVELGRRFCEWIILRVKFQYSITAQFSEGDGSYEWIILFLTDAQVWKSSREFRVSAKSSVRKWSVKPDDSGSGSSGSTISSLFSLASLRTIWNSLPLVGDTSETASLHLEAKSNLLREEGGYTAPHVEYVPTYEAPQLFRWKGYWVEIKRNGGSPMYTPGMGHQSSSVIFLTIYTHDMNVLSAFVEEARQGYIKTNRPHVIVHAPDQHSYGPVFTWSTSKVKARRPLSSIILQEGAIDSLVADVKEFLQTEDWYTKAGIPHRRGYLLHGPPGTGKTSTIYALAGELGLEVYSLSLASSFMDDSFLQRAVIAIPKHSILLIEDIDCAFPVPRDASDSGEETYARMFGMPPRLDPMYSDMMGGRSRVTLSGLLNVLDGVGSEEGKIFFATTNHVKRLDVALLRPGRIDRKIQYNLATQAQAEGLFLRFYPESVLERDLAQSAKADDSMTEKKPSQDIPTLLRTLASQFSITIPPNEFSTAELQGYLLGWKGSPCQAATEIAAWVQSEMTERQEKIRNGEEKKQEKARAAAEKEATRYGPGVIPGLGMPMSPMSPTGLYPPSQMNGHTVSIPSPFGRDAAPTTAVALGTPAESMIPEAIPVFPVPVVGTSLEQAVEGLDVPIQKLVINGVE